MPPRDPRSITLSRRVLRALVVLNVLYGGAILVLFVASLAAEGPVMDALGVRAGEGRARLILGMRGVMAAGITSAVIGHLILARLLTLVETVRQGDPFVPENARGLHVIAWSLLALELVHLFIGATAVWASTDAQSLDLEWSFSFTPWVAFLLLLVIATVFDHGTRMRADLEGTV